MKPVLKKYVPSKQQFLAAVQSALDMAGGDPKKVDRHALVRNFARLEGAPHPSTLYRWITEKIGPQRKQANRSPTNPNMAREQPHEPRGPMHAGDGDGEASAAPEAEPEPEPRQAEPEDEAPAGDGPRNQVEPIVFQRDGVAYATSLDVAAFFEKRHDHVLRDIDVLMAHARNLGDEGEQALSALFAPIDVPHPTVPGRVDRGYRMTRDGFVLLAMGFTGRKALAFKLSYLAAFNRMEAAIHEAISGRPGGKVLSFSPGAAQVIGGIVKKAAIAQDKRHREHADALATGIHAGHEMIMRELAAVKAELATVKRAVAGGFTVNGTFTFVPTMDADTAPPANDPAAAKPRQGKLL